MPAETAPRSSTRPEVAAGLAWHALSPEKALRALDSSPGGLSKTEALQRLAVHGANELPAAAGLSWPYLLARQFRSLLVIILLVACVLAMGLGEPIEAAAIFVIVMLSVALGFFQEYRAERAMEALRGVAAPQARVLRDGRQTDRPARELVPGDLVLLVAGDRVPADARLLESANLRINEAPLTGESLPVEKDSLRQEAPEAPVADRRNMVFSGTTVSYGRGRAVVTGTGPATAIGLISSLLASVEKRATPLQKNLDRLGRVLAIVALVIVALISVSAPQSRQPGSPVPVPVRHGSGGRGGSRGVAGGRHRVPGHRRAAHGSTQCVGSASSGGGSPLEYFGNLQRQDGSRDPQRDDGHRDTCRRPRARGDGPRLWMRR